MRKVFNNFLSKLFKRKRDSQQNAFSNPQAFNHKGGIAKKFKQKFKGHHSHQIEKELERPFVFLFVPKWNKGRIVPSRTKITVRDKKGRPFTFTHAAFDKEKSEWIFNPKLAEAGYKEQQFGNAKTFMGEFSIAKHFQYIHGNPVKAV